ncbi:MAG: DUF1232 domain-containing protein [Dehalococcoidia bacterium]|nr:DUF1232 domain-containing protein [Dehalococcoidia bacterium]
MPVLIVLILLVATAVALAALGMAAERRPAVRDVLRRIEPLSYPQRGRLGVWLAKDPQVPPLVRYLQLAAFIYWIIPIDFIPDALPRIGASMTVSRSSSPAGVWSRPLPCASSSISYASSSCARSTRRVSKTCRQRVSRGTPLEPRRRGARAMIAA